MTGTARKNVNSAAATLDTPKKQCAYDGRT